MALAGQRVTRLQAVSGYQPTAGRTPSRSGYQPTAGRPPKAAERVSADRGAAERVSADRGADTEDRSGYQPTAGRPTAGRADRGADTQQTLGRGTGRRSGLMALAGQRVTRLPSQVGSVAETSMPRR